MAAMQSVQAAKEKIANHSINKLEALDAEEKEIRWAITSVWNY